MAQPQAPILDLGVLAKRPKVRINNQIFEMRTAKEFAYLLYSDIQASHARLGVLLSKDRHRKTKREWTEQARLQDSLVRQILIAPEAIHSALGDFERIELITAFFAQLPPTMRRTAADAMNGRRQARSRTGAR